MTAREILKSCFSSSSNLWKSFTNEIGELNTLYYPSAAVDMRPFVFSKKENLNYIGLDLTKNNYIEPNLFIFSDYFPYPTSRFFDSAYLHWDDYTEIYIEEYCELFPTDNYNYNFNKKHVHFHPSQATGKAIFFQVKITSHKVKESYRKHGIYFFYENVNLIEQLFLINKMPFSHLVWKRDGSGLGGGSVKLNFIYNIAVKCGTKYFFLWDHYLNEDQSIKTKEEYRIENLPEELRNYLTDEFQLSLHKKLKIRWEKYDRMNLYFANNNDTSQLNEIQ
jgi:hypothetical protein